MLKKTARKRHKKNHTVHHCDVQPSQPLSQPLIFSHTAYGQSSSSSSALSVSNSFTPREITWEPQLYQHIEDDSFPIPSGADLDFPHPELDDAGAFDGSFPSRRNKFKSDQPLHVWSAYIDQFVSEFIRLEGRGDPANFRICFHCKKVDNVNFRCEECVDCRLYCAACIVECHRAQPFHRLQYWNGIFFKRTTLAEIDPNFCIQLSHPLGEVCPLPESPFGGSFVVLDVNGIHAVKVQYCACVGRESRHVQLLRYRLFPATTVNPMTVATFRVLRHFQLLSFMSKCSGLEYYNTLARLTDNTGLNVPPDRRREFMRMIREWRHLQMVKRAGRGHEPGGVAATKKGECAVLCPACPQPGLNIPDDWREASKPWLYHLFVAMDATFRARRLNVSSDANDPGLNHGYAYFVENSRYKEHLATFDDMPDEAGTGCNNFDAIKLANIRGGKGIAASGLSSCGCSRHDMKRPGSIGDLQKGECYVNMDYVLMESMKNMGDDAMPVVLSYDIACQYSVNLFKRVKQYPPSLRLRQKESEILFLVPKFHLHAHVLSCQLAFSFNLTPHVGRTDGEAPERGWAAINALAPSTKEMGPGSRRDTLDDHFGDQNWRKTTTIASSLIAKLKQVITENTKHQQMFDEFDQAIPTESTVVWKAWVERWEGDHSTPNPFATTVHPLTSAVVRRRLAEEDDARAVDDTSVMHRDMTPGALISKGIELEESQRSLRAAISSMSTNATDLQYTQILERGNGLQRRITAWIAVQHLYMPLVANLRLQAEEAGGDTPRPFKVPLLLPSSLANRVPCDRKLQEYEWSLCEAQALDALGALHRHVLCRSHIWYDRTRNIRGQRAGLRSWAVLDNIKASMNMDAARYRSAYNALTSLSTMLGKGDDWRKVFRPLLDEDIRGMSVDEDGGTEGTRVTSWIWRTAGFARSESEELQEALRIEWCKTRARAFRWKEECELIQEEMRRVRAFFQSQQGVWLSRTSLTGPMDPSLEAMEGRRAYAHRQVVIREQMISKCDVTWSPVPAWIAAGRIDETDVGNDIVT